MRAALKMESGPPESCKTMKNRGIIPENNHKIRPKGRILFCDCMTQYAERKPAIGRAVSARLIARRIYQARIGTGTAGGVVLLDFRQAKTIRLEFAPGQARYAEREPATSRVGPMVLFDHRPTRTNWPPALPGKNPPFPKKQGIFHTNCSTQYAERRNAGDGVPYGPISIRRAEASDRSGGFCSPYGSHNLPVTSLAVGPGRLRGCP